MSFIKETCFNVITSDNIILKGYITMSDTISNINTIVLYLPNPNHSNIHTTHIRNALCKNMAHQSPVIISFSYRGFHSSEGFFDFFHPEQYSCKDTIHVLDIAYKKLKSSMISINESYRIVLIADGLSILLAKQLFKTSYSFSHIVCFEQIPDCAANLFTTLNKLQHTKIRSTFRFISHARLPSQVAESFQNLYSPYLSLLFPAIRGVHKNIKTTNLSYHESLQIWKTYMLKTYPHFFETIIFSMQPYCHYFIQQSKHYSTKPPQQYDGISKSITYHTTDKWTLNMNEYNICIARMCRWYNCCDKKSGNHYIDINDDTITYYNINGKTVRNLLQPYYIDRSQNCMTLTTTVHVSTVFLPNNWIWISKYLLPMFLRSQIISTVGQLSYNINPFLTLEHSFTVPTRISGYPICTMNIRSQQVQSVMFSIILFHRVTGRLHVLLDEYEHDIDASNNIVQTIRILLPFTHTIIEKDILIIIGISRYRSMLGTFREWVYGNSSSVNVSNVWLEFPIIT
jgi:hypothetical protein